MVKKVGTKAGERIDGSNQADELLGKGGNDKLFGKGGKDLLKGQGGNDKAYGGGGDDEVYGGGGNDKLWGDAGDDELYGGGGKDKLYGDAGNDELYGGGAGDGFYFLGNSDRDDVFGFQLGLDKLFIDLSAYGYASLQELLDNAKSSGGDTQIMLNPLDPGDDTKMIVMHGVASIDDLQGHIFDV